jgi:L-amino acid N-acyltransferase YncA
MPVVELRDAVQGDLPAILDIYNDVILTVYGFA